MAHSQKHSPKTITVYDDDALAKGISLEEHIKGYLNKGWKIVHTYMHPAVGRAYVLEIASRLAEV